MILYMLSNELLFGSAIWENVLKSGSWETTAAIFTFLFKDLQLLWFLQTIASIMASTASVWADADAKPRDEKGSKTKNLRVKCKK